MTADEVVAPDCEECCERCERLASFVVRPDGSSPRFLCRAHFREFEIDREIQRQRDLYAAQKARAGQ